MPSIPEISDDPVLSFTETDTRASSHNTYLPMQPPPSPTRASQNLGRGLPHISSPSTPVLSTSPPGNANPGVSAALQGATLAFNKQKKAVGGNTIGRGPSPPTLQNQGARINNSTAWDLKAGGGSTIPAQRTGLQGDNGALLAATQAAREHAASRPTSATAELGSAGVSRHATGASVSGTGGTPEAGTAARPTSQAGEQGQKNSAVQRVSELHGSTLLSPPAGRYGGDGARQGSTSPSLIAATLAASRSASPVRGPSPEPGPGSGRATRNTMASPVGPGTKLGRTDELEVPDTAPIPPTTSLVSLFESKRGEQDALDPVKKRAPSRDSGADGQARLERAQQGLQKAKPKPKPKPKPRLSTDGGRPELSDEANESPQAVSQLADTRSSDHNNPLPKSRGENRESRKPAKKPKPPEKRSSAPQFSVPVRVSSNHISTQPTKLTKPPRVKPSTPPARRSSIARMPDPTVQARPVDTKQPEIDATQRQQEEVPSPRRPSQASTSSNDTFVSASSVQSRPISPVKGADRPRPPKPPARSSSLRSVSNPDLQRTQAPTPNLTLNSLTNAIVASNLASARLTPSQQLPPPVPTPRRPGRSPGSRSPLQPQRTAESIRSQLTGGKAQPPPLPQRKAGTLLPTLRGPHPSLSDDEDARRRIQQHRHHRRRDKVPFGGNSKHAHHEGSRRRWRDEITPRERRRYEAVWASNRGLFLRKGWGFHYPHSSSPHGSGGPEKETEMVQSIIEASRPPEGTPEADLVVNIVVRDIWARSRLPADELAEVWELVDRQRRGALGREEFVVGMWLIDQRLRGRKIPTRVSQSVWDSAGGGYGGVVVPPVPAGTGRGKRR